MTKSPTTTLDTKRLKQWSDASNNARITELEAKKQIDDRNRDLCDARRELSMAQAVVAKAQAKIDKLT